MSNLHYRCCDWEKTVTVKAAQITKLSDLRQISRDRVIQGYSNAGPVRQLALRHGTWSGVCVFVGFVVVVVVCLFVCLFVFCFLCGGFFLVFFFFFFLVGWGIVFVLFFVLFCFGFLLWFFFFFFLGGGVFLWLLNVPLSRCCISGTDLL